MLWLRLRPISLATGEAGEGDRRRRLSVTYMPARSIHTRLRQLKALRESERPERIEPPLGRQTEGTRDGSALGALAAVPFSATLPPRMVETGEQTRCRRTTPLPVLAGRVTASAFFGWPGEPLFSLDNAVGGLLRIPWLLTDSADDRHWA